MKLLIDTTELQLLLEKKRDYIGNERYSGIDVIFAGVTFLISSFYSKYPDVGILS